MKNPMGSAHRADQRRPDGFTRIELAVSVFAAALLLGVVVVPALAVAKSDSGRATCFNNLRLVGRAVQVWASDHGQLFPWRTFYADGGTSIGNQPRPGNCWIEYASFSNELVTPKILACPSDAGVKQAWTFDSNPNGGFLSPPYRQNAVSYSLNLDGSLDVPGAWLTGDRNFRADFPAAFCSTYVNNAYAIVTIFPPQNSLLQWTNAVHGLSGHLLTSDGSVEYTFTPRLKEIVLQSGRDDNGQIHFLKAR